jgi:hypothetical protein
MEHVMFDRLVEQFCEFDDFCQSIGTQWAAYLVADGHRLQRQHGPRGGLCDSEIMLLLVLSHSSRFKNFKGSVATLKTVTEDAAKGTGQRGLRPSDRTAGR